MFHSLIFHGETLHCLPSGALYWPSKQLLCVSDLHLGKSERLARRGGALLPPYETRATLERLDADLERTGAACVICLGDSFDDAASLDGLDEADRLWLTRMIAGRDWIWVEGNHDAGPIDISGTHRATVAIAPLIFQHIANPLNKAEISGHYHPKVRLAGQSMRCFLCDKDRLILPAYGAYTGGLWASDPVLCDMMAPDALALACASSGVHALPKPRTSTRSR
ncbi:ligase-associated DNA damage response endonuclease PdeM [Thioclava sp. FR2]|uniref:ligase-associated DNA damage response endonuclease PdeM n=1 Tax=Thioclava sp. FR2 TaxID=3445780 RepID=UPI003EBF8D81